MCQADSVDLSALAQQLLVAMLPTGQGLYAAYGVRLTTFLLRRQSDESYAKKFHEVQLKTDNMGPGPSEDLQTFDDVCLAEWCYRPWAMAGAKALERALPWSLA